MFPFWMNPCCQSGAMTQKSYQQHKLEFLKWRRDSLETHLAAVNAAITTMERQMNEIDSANSNPSA